MKTRFDKAPDHLNPTCLGIHKEEAHFEGISYLSHDDLEQQLNKTRISLNGRWKFKLYPNPDAAKAVFPLTEPQEPIDWDDISVPGVWELQGFGKPYYLSKSFPPQVSVKKSRIPAVSKSDNPCGAYVTSFTLPDAFSGQLIFIRFLAVKSAMRLWINGIEAGFSKASMTSHEFDITALVKDGVNQVAVLVTKFSDGTYLEDQDMWFFAGITRDVFVLCEPKTYLFDAFASCTLINDDTDALLRLQLTIRTDDLAGLSMKAVLSDQTDQVLFQGRLDQKELLIETLVNHPHLWSAETPRLYPIKLYLYRDDLLIQAKRFNFGFRSVEIRGTQFLVNGKPIKFKGVNRHDFDPELGWGISQETRLKDLLIMKAHNINAIRTSHYPNHPQLYDLADELGFYVIDEADVESHGVRNFLPKNDPIWGNAVIDRARRMVLRDRNHPCIVMWSLGNEAGSGSVFLAERQAIKALDPIRPIHYEGDKQKGLSDVYSMMYPSPQEEIMFGEKQDIRYKTFTQRFTKLFLTRQALRKEDYQDLPVMNCEYAHCMENSLGNLKEHVDNFEKYDNWIGGFIWDFVDQSIKQLREDKTITWLYGGDFGEEKTDAYFCANGLIASDRSLHPAISEVKQVYANLTITDYDPSDHSVLITNKNVFIDTAYALFIAKILRSGIMIDQVLMNVPSIAPGHSARIAVEGLTLPPCAEELILEIDAVEKLDRPWAKQGHEIVFGQFIVKAPARKESLESSAQPIHLHQNKDVIIIASASLSASINKQSGWIESLDYGQGNILKAPLMANFTRADIDNDCGIELFVPPMRHFNAIRQWEKAAAKLKVAKIATAYTEGCFKVTVRYAMPYLKSFIVNMTFHPDGKIDLINEVVARKAMIRFGMNLGLDPHYQNLEFYGRGPQENYCDRKSGSKIGLYQGRIRDFTHDYMRPQENGNHTDVRFLTLCDGKNTLRFEAITPALLQTSVWPYTQEELSSAAHIHELPEQKMTTVNLDYGQKGVAGDLPGFYFGPQKYKLNPGQATVYGFCVNMIQTK